MDAGDGIDRVPLHSKENEYQRPLLRNAPPDPFTVSPMCCG